MTEFLQTGSGYEDWVAVTLFYAAHQMVHSSLSGEPSLPKDERHPRKHVSPPGHGNGGRGTNQLVGDFYPSIHVPYMSLYEASRRTRYDLRKWPSPGSDQLLRLQYDEVAKFCKALNGTRGDISTQAP